MRKFRIVEAGAPQALPQFYFLERSGGVTRRARIEIYSIPRPPLLKMEAFLLETHGTESCLSLKRIRRSRVRGISGRISMWSLTLFFFSPNEVVSTSMLEATNTL